MYPPDVPPDDSSNTTPNIDYHPETLHNATSRALQAIIDELGAGPKGSDADATTRLARIQAEIDAIELDRERHRRAFFSGDAQGGSDGNGTTGRPILFNNAMTGRTDWGSDSFSRFTPDIEGFYAVHLHAACPGTIDETVACRIKRNGVTRAGSNDTRVGGYQNFVNASYVQWMNGVSDYIEGHWYGDVDLSDADLTIYLLHTYDNTSTWTNEPNTWT